MKTDRSLKSDNLVIRYDCILFMIKSLNIRKEYERSKEAHYQSFIMNIPGKDIERSDVYNPKQKMTAQNKDKRDKCKIRIKECRVKLKKIEKELRKLSAEKESTRSALLNIYRSKERGTYMFFEHSSLLSSTKNITISDKSGKTIELILNKTCI